MRWLVLVLVLPAFAGCLQDGRDGAACADMTERWEWREVAEDVARVNDSAWPDDLPEAGIGSIGKPWMHLNRSLGGGFGGPPGGHEHTIVTTDGWVVYGWSRVPGPDGNDLLPLCRVPNRSVDAGQLANLPFEPHGAVVGVKMSSGDFARFGAWVEANNAIATQAFSMILDGPWIRFTLHADHPDGDWMEEPTLPPGCDRFDDTHAGECPGDAAFAREELLPAVSMLGPWLLLP